MSTQEVYTRLNLELIRQLLMDNVAVVVLLIIIALQQARIIIS
jgi:hypothetical protein